MKFFFLLFFLVSCAQPMPDGSTPLGSKEELDRINNAISKFEKSNGLELSGDDVLISRDKKNSIWIFIKKNGDFYRAFRLTDLENIPFGNAMVDLILKDTVLTFRYKLIMGTNMFGRAVPYQLFSGSIPNGSIFEETQIFPKDLEKIGALIDQYQQERSAKVLVDNWSFEEGKALELSRLIYHWKKIQKSRKMTDKDIKHFGIKLLGPEYVDIKNKLERFSRGENINFEDILSKVALHNGVDPEAMRDVLNNTFLINFK